jgi:CRP/FNR family transcriptional regulator, cyclic AMP receptor protein
VRKALYVLGQLDDADVDWMARWGSRELFDRGHVLIQQGIAIDALYIILEGEVSVAVAGLGEIAHLGPGELIGEMSFVDFRPPSASVSAVTDVQALRLDRKVLLSRLETDSAFASRFYRAIAMFLADRLRGTVVRLGYGEDDHISAATEIRGELDEPTLATLHLAGGRFNRLLGLVLSRR